MQIDIKPENFVESSDVGVLANDAIAAAAVSGKAPANATVDHSTNPPTVQVNLPDDRTKSDLAAAIDAISTHSKVAQAASPLSYTNNYDDLIENQAYTSYTNGEGETTTLQTLNINGAGDSEWQGCSDAQKINGVRSLRLTDITAAGKDRTTRSEHIMYGRLIVSASQFGYSAIKSYMMKASVQWAGGFQGDTNIRTMRVAVGDSYFSQSPGDVNWMFNDSFIGSFDTGIPVANVLTFTYYFTNGGLTRRIIVGAEDRSGNSTLGVAPTAMLLTLSVTENDSAIPGNITQSPVIVDDTTMEVVEGII